MCFLKCSPSELMKTKISFAFSQLLETGIKAFGCMHLTGTYIHVKIASVEVLLIFTNRLLGIQKLVNHQCPVVS